MTTDPEPHGAALRAHLQEHIAAASPDELRVLVDDLAEHLARRVGTYAPFVHAAIGGIRQAIDRHQGVPRSAPPHPSSLRTPPDTPVPPARP